MKGEIEAKLGQTRPLCCYTSHSDVEAKKLESTFLMTMDGIIDNYFKGVAKAKTTEEKTPSSIPLPRERLRAIAAKLKEETSKES